MLLYSQNESNVQSNSIQKLYLKMVTPYTKIYKHVWSLYTKQEQDLPNLCI